MDSNDIMLGFSIAVGALFVIAVGYYIHLKSVMKDILEDEKKKLREWAYKEAEIRAEEKFMDIMKSIYVEIPVNLVNESDTYWGEN